MSIKIINKCVFYPWNIFTVIVFFQTPAIFFLSSSLLKCEKAIIIDAFCGISFSISCNYLAVFLCKCSYSVLNLLLENQNENRLVFLLLTMEWCSSGRVVARMIRGSLVPDPCTLHLEVVRSRETK